MTPDDETRRAADARAAPSGDDDARRARGPASGDLRRPQARRATPSEPEPEAPETERRGRRFTEEFDAIERDLDRELAEPGADERGAAEDERRGADAEEPEDDAPDERAPRKPSPRPRSRRRAEELGPTRSRPMPTRTPARPSTPPRLAGETVEAETLALADREQAEEAALAGLRARAAKQGATAAAASDHAAAAAAAGAASRQPPPPAAATRPTRSGKTPARKAPVGALPRRLAADRGLDRRGDLDQPPASTSPTSPRASRDNDTLASLRDQLTEADGGDPQTILIIGSDKRLDTRGRPGPLRHDDPAARRPRQGSRSRCSRSRATSGSTSPGVGRRQVQRRLLRRRAGEDAAGGQAAHRARDQPRRQHRLHRLRRRGQRDRLRLRRRRPPLLHPAGDRDRRRSTSRPATSACAATRRSQYVRFRHFDNDLVRSARQQDFLREARQKLPPGVADPRPQRAARHLHRVHDVGHRRRGAAARAAEDVRRGAVGAGPRGPLPGRARRRRT